LELRQTFQRLGLDWRKESRRSRLSGVTRGVIILRATPNGSTAPSHLLDFARLPTMVRMMLSLIAQTRQLPLIAESSVTISVAPWEKISGITVRYPIFRGKRAELKMRRWARECPIFVATQIIAALTEIVEPVVEGSEQADARHRGNG
jgi:hypothetical protein